MSHFPLNQERQVGLDAAGMLHLLPGEAALVLGSSTAGPLYKRSLLYQLSAATHQKIDHQLPVDREG